MPTERYDAHVHLADRTLAKALSEIASVYTAIHLKKAVVVGSDPADWPKVIELGEADKRFIPAVGLHPWKVNQAPPDWRDRFLDCLNAGVPVIGEIGLDQWIDGYDIERQEQAFRWQLSLAAERNLPTSIHCLKAHEPLLKTLRSIALPERGFKLHAYNGPPDTVTPLLELGACFSFNAGQLKPTAKRVYDIIRKVPDDRLLIETDAPNFQLPAELREFELADPELCHPGNLTVAYREVARVRGLPEKTLAEQVADNFKRYFLAPGGSP
jgi:TatD DNase family protein